jgi:acylphosphatase
VKTIEIMITGKVQGVFFRQSTKEKATGLGINGIVRNLPDKSVQIVCTGTSEQLNTLINWCRQGPPRASVTHVDWNEQGLQSFNGFTIAR